MKAGDVVFVRGRSIISRLVELVDGKFSHVAIAVSDDEVLEADWTGTVIHRMKPDGPVEVMDLGISDGGRARVRGIAEKWVGKRYDYPQILGILLLSFVGLRGKRHLFDSPKRLICSEVVADVLAELCYIKREEIPDVTPNTLYAELMRVKSETYKTSA